MIIYIQYKFRELPSIGYLGVAKDGKPSRFRQSKGNNSFITNDSLMKLHMHNHTIVICIQYKIHEILFISYQVMVEDRKNN